MADKLQTYVQLAQNTAQQLTSSYESWTSFLQTAARLYKYSYPDQLLIHAQRPDAVACASYNVWNNTMHRYVRRGSKGIALIDSSSDNVKLHYVFDLSDTGTGRNSRQPFLWQLHEEHESAVTEAIKERFDVGDAVNFRAFLEETASILVDDYWFAHKSEVLDIIEGSALAGYNEDDLSYFFQQAAVVSTSYLLLTRCGMTPGEEYEKADFTTVFDFNTPDAVAALGTAVSLISESVLREIETTIRKYERERNAERSQNNERTDLHHERGLSPAQPDLAAAAHDASEQVRKDAQSLPEGAQAGAVEHDAAERDAGQPSQGDQRDGGPAAEPDDAGDGGSAGSDGATERQRSDGLDAADERPEGTGRGSDPHGAGLQLSFLDVSFPSEAEQIQTIQQAESALFAPFAFSVPQDTVDQILRLGSNAAEHRKFLATEYSKGKTIENISAILRTTYHGGNGFETALGPISVWYAEEGIRIARGTSARYVRTAQVISWEDAAKRIGELLDAGQFATSLDIASAPGRERYQLAETLSYIVRNLSEQARKQEAKEQKDFEVNMDTSGLAVSGHVGTWHTIDHKEVDGHTFFLMEHDTYGDEAACLIVDEHGKLSLSDVYNGFDEHTVDLLRQEVMAVDRMPDPSISAAEMKEYGYAWVGMLPMREEAAAEVMKTCSVYRLYADNSEGLVLGAKEIHDHAAKGGIFGVEKVEWKAAMERENYLKAAEMSTEDDYGMIDGIINNGPKETEAKAPEKTSIMDRLKAAKSEPHEEKAKPHKERKPERDL